MTGAVTRNVALALLAAVAAWPLVAQDGAVADPAGQPAKIAPLAARALLLDVAAVDELLVAVGERGHILRSTDGGASWEQQPAPLSAGLTAVYFLDAKRGWVVGHDESILRTVDGGRTWERVQFLPERRQPLLDVWFGDADNGLAVGAYGTVYASGDGGRTWELMPFTPAPPAGVRAAAAPGSRSDEYEEDLGIGSDPHLNAIVRAADGTLFLGAETGRLFRSDDAGASWQELASPYEGSFYGLLPLAEGGLLAFGLRGNLFRSDDRGTTWRTLESGTTAMLTSATRLDDGRIVIAGLAGVLLVSRDGGQTFALSQAGDRKGYSAVVPAGGSTVVAVGEGGARRLTIDGGQS